jgi:hypothetical protein
MSGVHAVAHCGSCPGQAAWAFRAECQQRGLRRKGRQLAGSPSSKSSHNRAAESHSRHYSQCSSSSFSRTTQKAKRLACRKAAGQGSCFLVDLEVLGRPLGAVRRRRSGCARASAASGADVPSTSSGAATPGPAESTATFVQAFWKFVRPHTIRGTLLGTT